MHMSPRTSERLNGAPFTRLVRLQPSASDAPVSHKADIAGLFSAFSTGVSNNGTTSMFFKGGRIAYFPQNDSTSQSSTHTHTTTPPPTTQQLHREHMRPKAPRCTELPLTSPGLSAAPRNHGAPGHADPLQSRERAFSVVACVRCSDRLLLPCRRRSCRRRGAGRGAPCAFSVAPRCIVRWPALAALGQLLGAPDDDFAPSVLKKQKKGKRRREEIRHARHATGRQTDRQTDAWTGRVK